MGYIKEPDGITLEVDPRKLTKEEERLLHAYIQRHKKHHNEKLKGVRKKLQHA